MWKSIQALQITDRGKIDGMCVWRMCLFESRAPLADFIASWQKILSECVCMAELFSICVHKARIRFSRLWDHFVQALGKRLPRSWTLGGLVIFCRLDIPSLLSVATVKCQGRFLWATPAVITPHKWNERNMEKWWNLTTPVLFSPSICLPNGHFQYY